MAEINISSRSGNSKSRRLPIKIDMTPMVDLAFLLLTFFMLTTSFNGLFVLNIESPEKTGEGSLKIKPEQVLTLILGENNRVYWYQGIEDPKLYPTDFSEQGVGKVLRDKKAEVKDMAVLIKPSDKSRFENLANILDELIDAEIHPYNIVEMTPADKKLVEELGQ